MPAQAATLAIAAVLVTSAAAKLTSPASARALAVQVFGAPPRTAEAFVAGLAIVEYALAVALAVAPAAPTLVTALALFAGFAAVGAQQLATRSRISCGCLGALATSRVGWPQILQLVPVTALLAYASSLSPAGTAERLLWLLAAHLIACGLLLVGFARAWHTVRTQRVSMEITR